MSGMLQHLYALLLSTPPHSAPVEKAAALEAPLHAGLVHGGWGYIYFCYALTWLSLLAYAVYLLRLRRRLKTLPPPNP